MKTKAKLVLWLITTGITIIPRVDLWGVGAVQAKRFARSRWWSRAPFLPLPGSSYWEFRMESIYGNPSALPSRSELIEYLEWCLEIR